jgi:hypothetical protein
MANNYDALASAFRNASQVAFGLEQALQDAGDSTNASLIDHAVNDLSQAATDANAMGISQLLAGTAADQTVLSSVTASLNASANAIAHDVATVHKWISIASNALSIVAKAGSGNVAGALANAQAIIGLLH